MNPKVSVIIPTYNRAAKVQNAIESVLAQTFSDFEVIVVDDGSSDGTGRILQEVYGDRIRCFAQANQGVSVARNKGIAEARGKWIAFLDSDDLWEKEKLEWQFKTLEQFGSHCGGCYTDTRLMNHPERRTLFQMAEHSYRHEREMGVNPDVLRLLVRPGGAGMVVCISSLLARADVVKKTGGYDPKLGFYADSEFMFRLALLTDFCYVNRPLVWFDRSPDENRHVGASKDWDRLEFILQESKVRLEGFLRMTGVPPKVCKVIRQHLSTVYSGLANSHLETGNHGSAREAMSRALRLNMTLNIAAKWVLTWVSPQLALLAVRNRQARKSDLYPSL